MNNLSQFFKVVTIAHFALMHTLQNPNVLTPCIRLSAVAPQPRAAVRALRGHPGEKGEDRDSGSGVRDESGSSVATRTGPSRDSQGRDRPSRLKAHWLKAVAALAGRGEGDGCGLRATPRASTRDLGRERPDAERTDSAASPRSPSLVVVRVVDREESADAR